jgi:aminomethyltransferase
MPSRKTPFYDLGLARGADMRELFGYWLPWEYAEGHVEEHKATRERASLCDLDYMAEFKIVGPQALDFVQNLFTNDFRTLPIGGVKYTAMCNDGGYIVDDGTVWRFGDDEFLYISGDEADYAWVAEQASEFEISLDNITGAWTTLALQGPDAYNILQPLTSGDLRELDYYRFFRSAVDDTDCVIARVGYTGEFGYELHFPPESAAAVWQAVMSAGEDHQIAPCGQAALESLRQEAGYLLVGNDHNKATNPVEAGIVWTIAFEKDRFNGRDALLEILDSGVSRKMVWLKLESDAEASNGDAIVLPGGRKIGEVTSGSYSPTSTCGVAMGYVDSRHAIHRVKCEVVVQGENERATLQVMPLYDPGDLRTKSRLDGGSAESR